MAAQSTAPIETRVLWGDPATTLCDVANTQPCELMVMCTHGRTGLAHVFIGSVAERAVRSAPCHVRIVHAFLQPQPSIVRQQIPTTLPLHSVLTGPALRASTVGTGRIRRTRAVSSTRSAGIAHARRRRSSQRFTTSTSPR
jgi:hypothetical protein